MSIFHRIGLVIAQKANAATEAAEDPSQAISYSEVQLVELEHQAEQAMVTHRAALNTVQAQFDDLNAQADARHQQAEQLMGADPPDEATAGLALQSEQTLRAQAAGIKPGLDAEKAKDTQLITQVKTLQTKIAAFHVQAKVLKAEAAAAQANDDVASTISGISEKAADINLMISHAQDKIDSHNAHADAASQLLDSGALESLGLPGGNADPIAAKAALAASQSSVQAQLAAMKAKRLAGASPADAHLLTDGGITVRIVGDHQYTIGSADKATLEAFDQALVAAVNANDSDAFASSLSQVVKYVQAHGTPLAEDVNRTSDVFVPAPTMSLADTVKLFVEHGQVQASQPQTGGQALS